VSRRERPADAIARSGGPDILIETLNKKEGESKVRRPL
jgi:hypothetical protein